MLSVVNQPKGKPSTWEFHGKKRRKTKTPWGQKYFIGIINLSITPTLSDGAPIVSKKVAAQAAERLQESIQTLEKIPVQNKEGFHRIGEQMGAFSGSFATNATRAASISDRVSSNSEFGLSAVREDLRKVYWEIKNATQAVETLISKKETLGEQLNRVIKWTLALEQKAFLPPIADHVKQRSDDPLEAQTLAAIIDNLMQQARPLIHETIAASQTASDVISHLGRRMASDLETTRHGLEGHKTSNADALKRMTNGIKGIHRRMEEMGDRAKRANKVVFDMVSAMQYDDITSQRLEHVVSGINDAQKKIPGAKGKKAGKKESRWFVAALHLAAHQVEDTQSDLQGAMEDVRRRLGDLATDAAGQVKESGDVRHIGRRFRNDSAELAYNLGAIMGLPLLSDSLTSEVMRSLSAAENGIHQAKRAITMLLMTTERLGALVESLKNHNKNQQLDILTNSVQEYAKLVNEQAPAKLEELNAIFALLDQINLSYADKVTPRLMRTNSWLRRIPLSAHQMDANMDDMQRVMNTILGDAKATNIQVDLLISELNFHQEIDGMLADAGAWLRETVTPFGGQEEELSDEEMTEVAAEFDDLAALYTMASERRAHDQALGGGGGDDDEDEDDIELF